MCYLNPHKKRKCRKSFFFIQYFVSFIYNSQSGLTPLHVASFMGCMNIVIYLLQHGAGANAPTMRGETPLHLAARANQTDIVRILLRNNAHVDARARVFIFNFCFINQSIDFPFFTC